MADVGAPARPVVSGYHGIILMVRDVQRSVAFYRDLLGIPLRSDPADAEWAEAELPDGTRFALHAAGDIVPHGESMDLYFDVADPAAAERRLRDGGATVGETRRTPWGMRCRVEDPDGYQVMLRAAS